MIVKPLGSQDLDHGGRGYPRPPLRNVGELAGCWYTQFADTHQEGNGLLYDDRTLKIPIAQIASATAGPSTLAAKVWNVSPA